MKSKSTLLLLCFVSFMLLASFSMISEETNGCFGRKKKVVKYEVIEEANPDLAIRQGLLCNSKQTVKIKRGRKTLAKVELGNPVIVAQADKVEKWGFFQFPGIFRNEEGNLIVVWQMGEDSFKATNIGTGMMMSRDEGITWEPLDKEYFHKRGNRVDMKCGDIIQVNTPAPRVISDYSSFPKPVCKQTSDGRLFYLESELPEDLRGMYLRRWYADKNTSKRFHANLLDPGLLRCSQDGLMPVQWLGRISEFTDGTLIAGVYPAYYRNSEGQLLNSGISFYKSTDEGLNWSIIGKIPYIPEGFNEAVPYNNDEGFGEPSYEILNDSTFFCVMRSGSFSPVYKSYSYDGGHNWTKPEAFISNGVFPRLLKLDNGVMVLSSGRPGVQLRFNIGGDGKYWTEPLEMIPYMDTFGNYPKRVKDWETCGYTNMMAVDDQSFYLVYSDFGTKNKDGDKRKAIIFRKITVKTK